MKIDHNRNGINPLAGGAGNNGIFGNGKPLIYLGASKYSKSGTITPLEEKTADARKKAMKLVSDAFQGELDADKMMDAQRDRFKELRTELNDLESLIKTMEESGLLEEATAEEQKDYADSLQEFRKQADAAKAEMQAIDQTLRSSRIERLKSDPMAGAFDQAEDIMEAAMDAAVSEAVSEGMDHLQEELDEKLEEAKKLEEEKEELEERIEKVKESREEKEEITEEILEATQDEKGTQMSVAEAQDQVKNMLNRLGLIAEELKGAAIDEMK